METYTRPHQSPAAERTLGDLLGDLSQNAGVLVRQEIHLANIEMKQKASQAGKEVALIVAGTFLANAALLSLAAALILGLANFLEPWLAAFLVGLALALVAGVLAATGIQSLREINPLPERALASIEEDKEWLKQQMS